MDLSSNAQSEDVLSSSRYLRSHDAIGDVLERVVEFCCDGAHGSVHQLLHQQLQLLLRQRHVETLLQATDGAGAVETRQVRAYRYTKRQVNKTRRGSYSILLCSFYL